MIKAIMGWMANIDGCNAWGFLNWGSPQNQSKSSILIWFFNINDPFLGVTKYWNHHFVDRLLSTAWVNNLKPPSFGSLSFAIFFVPDANHKDLQEWPLAEKTQGTYTSYNAFNHLISQVCRSPWGAEVGSLWSERQRASWLGRRQFRGPEG